MLKVIKKPNSIYLFIADADGGTETSARKVPSRPAPPPPARPAPPQIKVSQQDQDSGKQHVMPYSYKL